MITKSDINNNNNSINTGNNNNNNNNLTNLKSNSSSSLMSDKARQQNYYPSQKQSQKQKARMKQKPSGASSSASSLPLPDYDGGFDYNDDFAKSIDSQIKQQSSRGRGKKISIDHLFSYESYRDSEQFHNSHHNNNINNHKNSRRGSGTKSRKDIINKVPLKGMTFINVNYKFVVDYTQDYNTQALDPNIPVNVKDIIRIIVPQGNSCPICLSDEIIAPRMLSSCGHIVCLKCLLSLLDSEVPEAKKKQSSAIVEKYKECPLCSSIIRQEQIKPVLISNIDGRFETPKIHNEVVLTLMSRPSNRLIPLPKNLQQYHEIIGNFPWINNDSDIECNKYGRIFKGNFQYLLDIFESEKVQIHFNYEEEKSLYNESYKYVQMSLDNIDKDIEKWSNYFKDTSSTPSPSINNNDNSTDVRRFYYYQTGFDTNATYVLSPLDIKVLKACYDDNYENLPSSIVGKIENIKFEELTEETSISKYKYLSHLPIGTQLGFLECDWRGKLSESAWLTYKDELNRRSHLSNKKFKREERNKRRAINQEEIKNRNFFITENSTSPNHSHNEDLDYGIGSLSINDNRRNIYLPVLEHESNSEAGGDDEFEDHNDDSISNGSPNLTAATTTMADTNDNTQYETTVWGTKIPKRNDNNDTSNEYDGDYDGYEDDGWDAEEMIRKAREEMQRQEELESQAGSNKSKKKKKKKLILLSSNSAW
ncbi:putative DNA-3-methyladenine glycosidase II [Scheffersomyces coipomensis]|uniref:putative DNA-3-methyladenine glycosidase II n=1 Tax=Scheffersomyces coipomensis TaxID=1788519 RepID=UPI00315D526D